MPRTVHNAATKRSLGAPAVSSASLPSRHFLASQADSGSFGSFRSFGANAFLGGVHRCFRARALFAQTDGAAAVAPVPSSGFRVSSSDWLGGARVHASRCPSTRGDGSRGRSPHRSSCSKSFARPVHSQPGAQNAEALTTDFTDCTDGIWSLQLPIVTPILEALLILHRFFSHANFANSREFDKDQFVSIREIRVCFLNF